MGRPPEFGGFSDVDRTDAPAEYAAYLGSVRDLEAVRAWKERSFELLEPRPGTVLLDAGCGTGEDVRALAELVGPGGRVIGVDASEALIAEARGRDHGRATEFRLGDVTRLPLPDASVDGCRAERLLMHLERPAAAIDEMTRVVRPGCRLVVSEPDWGTLVIDPGDPETGREVARAAAAGVRSGTAGRTLRRLLIEAGLTEVGVVARTLLVTDAGLAERIFGLETACARAVEDGRLTAAQVERWRAHLAEAAARDRYLVAMTAFMAWGRRAEPSAP
jgi:SAM-dependent methyltransferase